MPARTRSGQTPSPAPASAPAAVSSSAQVPLTHPARSPSRPSMVTSTVVAPGVSLWGLPCYTEVPRADLARVFDQTGRAFDGDDRQAATFRLGAILFRLDPQGTGLTDGIRAFMVRVEEVERATGGNQPSAYRAAAAKRLLVEFVLDLGGAEGGAAAGFGRLRPVGLFFSMSSMSSAWDVALARRITEQKQIDLTA